VTLAEVDPAVAAERATWTLLDIHTDDDYAVRWRPWRAPGEPGPSEHVASFEIVKIAGFSEGATKGVFDKPCFKRWPEGSASAEMVDEHFDATLFASGDVKWDGCCNMTFNEQRQCMLHFCGLGGWASLGEVMTKVWTEIALKIPAADRELVLR
jgi:hypothetical protein